MGRKSKNGREIGSDGLMANRGPDRQYYSGYGWMFEHEFIKEVKRDIDKYWKEQPLKAKQSEHGEALRNFWKVRSTPHGSYYQYHV